MKTLSVLVTLALLVAANQLATHLRHTKASPANAATSQNAVTLVRAQNPNANQ